MKKGMALILAVLLFIGAVPVMAAEAGAKASDVPGDVTGEGEVTSADALQIQRYVVKRQSVLSGEPADLMRLADVTQDGYVTSADALQIQRYVVHRSSVLDDNKTPTPTSKPTEPPLDVANDLRGYLRLSEKDAKAKSGLELQDSGSDGTREIVFDGAASATFPTYNKNTVMSVMVYLKPSKYHIGGVYVGTPKEEAAAAIAAMGFTLDRGFDFDWGSSYTYKNTKENARLELNVGSDGKVLNARYVLD